MTLPDVRRYVQEKVERHPSFSQISDQSPNEAKALPQQLIDKASGVFLWVVLACRSICDGIRDFDTLDELRVRIEALPPELEELFEHMLQKIEPFHREQGAKLLRLCYQNMAITSQDYLSAQSVDILDQYGMRIDTIPGFSQLQQTLIDEIKSQKRLEARLRSRCWGLLELKQRSMGRSVVQFMHRSVFEFLRSPGTLDLQCLQTGNNAFDASSLLAFIYTHDLYCAASGHNGRNIPDISDHDWRILACCGYAGGPAYETLSVVLSRLLEVSEVALSLKTFFAESPLVRNIGLLLGRFQMPSPSQDPELKLILALQFGMFDYVNIYLGLYGSDLVTSPLYRWPALFYAIVRPLLAGTQHSALHGNAPHAPELITALLNAGADPNQQTDDPSDWSEFSTPWERWLESKVEASNEHIEGAARTTEALLQAGADVLMDDLEEHLLYKFGIQTTDTTLQSNISLNKFRRDKILSILATVRDRKAELLRAGSKRARRDSSGDDLPPKRHRLTYQLNGHELLH